MDGEKLRLTRRAIEKKQQLEVQRFVKNIKQRLEWTGDKRAGSRERTASRRSECGEEYLPNEEQSMQCDQPSQIRSEEPQTPHPGCVQRHHLWGKTEVQPHPLADQPRRRAVGDSGGYAQLTWADPLAAEEGKTSVEETHEMAMGVDTSSEIPIPRKSPLRRTPAGGC